MFWSRTDEGVASGELNARADNVDDRKQCTSYFVELTSGTLLEWNRCWACIATGCAEIVSFFFEFQTNAVSPDRFFLYQFIAEQSQNCS